MNKPESDLRRRYLDTLERLEESEARWTRQENALRLTIGRLCLAARGRSERLDEELRTLGDLLRHEPSAEDIEACLETLSRAVAALDELAAPRPQSRSASDPGAVALPPRATAPEATPRREHEPPREVAPEREHAAARENTPDHERAAGPEGSPQSDLEGGERIQAAVAAMLDHLAALPELQPALAELGEQPIAALAPDELAEGLERVARLVVEQRSRLKREKLEIESLLRQIDTRLEEMSHYLAGEAADQKDVQASTQQLNLLVLDEMHELNTDVQRAIDIAELRGRVRSRLESITSHLQDFRSREEQRFVSQVERTGLLRVRIAELERESRNLQRSLQEEQRLAMIDALTGIANRAAYDERVRHELTYAQEHSGPISILAWDIDHFKAINDAYGHRAGDKVLRIVGQHLAHHVRGTDFVARYGGEEFVMILVGTDAGEAMLAADKIRAGIAKIGFHFRSKPVTVTASCGITNFRADDTPDTLFDRVDLALYRAKDTGRNRCVIL